MRILFLTQIIPYPPDSGPKVKTWHVLRYLAERGHQVHLASFIRPEEESHVDALRQICVEVQTIPIRRSRIADAGYYLRSFLRGRPFLIERDDLAAMRRCIQQSTHSVDFDYIHTDQLSMAQFALPAPRIFSEEVYRLERSKETLVREHGRRPKLIFDAHNAVWTIVERMGQNLPWYLQPLVKEEALRVKRYEGMLVQVFDHTLAVTEIDRQLLLQARQTYLNSLSNGSGLRVSSESEIPNPINVIPIAVDTQVLRPVSRKPGSINILTLGTLHYPPNADGIRWFANKVFPLIVSQEPGATLSIVGKNPPQDLRDLAKKSPDRFNVTGYVPDLVPYFEQSAAVVVPVRAGSGMRVRILEAFAQSMPVVTTTVGLEGIDANPGEDVLVADSPEDFASAVVRILRDPLLQAKLAENGRRLAESHYDWKVVLQKMDQIYAIEESQRNQI